MLGGLTFFLLGLLLLINSPLAFAAPRNFADINKVLNEVTVAPNSTPGDAPALLTAKQIKAQQLKRHRQLKISKPFRPSPFDSKKVKSNFDIPVVYNPQVKKWISYFQSPTKGQRWFRKWLERSHRYLPPMREDLRLRGLPEDLAFVAMIESGFSSQAISEAQAVGYWQFIRATADRYGLVVNWWLDERRDYRKSTNAAASYLSDLYKLFGDWYLAASAYNMGENRLKRLIQRHKTTDYWKLSQKPDFPKETKDYIPKLIATMLIAKAPRLYGFNDIKPMSESRYETFAVPGGTDLFRLARALGISREDLTKLNPELLHGFIPKEVSQHRIRIPTGFASKASEFVQLTL
jgi:membrane-bound lytic murein transglycosylase D